jgi:hypothetical protein
MLVGQEGNNAAPGGAPGPALCAGVSGYGIAKPYDTIDRDFLIEGMQAMGLIP